MAASATAGEATAKLLLWCSARANTSRPRSSAARAYASVASSRSTAGIGRPVCGSAVRSLSEMIPSSMLLPRRAVEDRGDRVQGGRGLPSGELLDMRGGGAGPAGPVGGVEPEHGRDERGRDLGRLHARRGLGVIDCAVEDRFAGAGGCELGELAPVHGVLAGEVVGLALVAALREHGGDRGRDVLT